VSECTRATRKGDSTEKPCQTKIVICRKISQKWSGPWKPGSRRRPSVLVAWGCWGNPRGDWEFGIGGDGEGLRKGRSVYE
jgi:hypothetical protein